MTEQSLNPWKDLCSKSSGHIITQESLQSKIREALPNALARRSRAGLPRIHCEQEGAAFPYDFLFTESEYQVVATN